MTFNLQWRNAIHLPKLRTADSAPMGTLTCDQPVSLIRFWDGDHMY